MGEPELFPSKEQAIVAEILGDVDAYHYSKTDGVGGPDGPWEFRSLKVRRDGNRILVWDVDGRRCDSFHVDVLSPEFEKGSHADALRGRLERLNEETLDEL